MKTLLTTAILLITFLNVNGQGIGELAPEKDLEIFPDNAFGLDIMFGEGGFGFGTFYRRQLNPSLTFFTDFSISEAKDDQEFEYIDPYFGYSITFGKVNRIFLLPVNFGLQYRLFENVIYDNLRPYINAGVGPTFAITTPYSMEFFEAFGKAQAKYAAGGYVGFGANFGLDKNNLVGLNFRYYYIQFFSDGVESLIGKKRKSLGSFYITINLGMMY